MTGGSSSNSSQTSKSLVTVIAGVVWAKCRAVEMDFGADSANPASVSINDTATDCDSCLQAKIGGGLFA